MVANTHLRRFDLDWLRVFCILSVFVYHTTRFFNLDPWSAKNAVTYRGVQLFTGFMDVWMMPMIFLISGASLFYAIGTTKARFSTGKFLKDKALRLLVPLVAAIFTHIVVDVYLDRLTNGKFSGTFFEFLPHYFDGVFLGSTSDGNFAFHGLHLWYLEILFIFCAITLPLFLFLKSQAGARILAGLTRLMAVPGVFYVLLALPVVLCQTFLDRSSPLGKNWFSWSFPVYMCFFIAGFEIVSSERLQNSIIRLRWVSLASAAALTALWILTDRHADVLVWALALTLLGFGMKHLNVNKPFLKYANEAVLPFYILHQSALICIGFFVVLWPVADLLKWAIIATSSLILCVGLYEGLIRRWNLLRFLFGMKMLQRIPRPAPFHVQPLGSLK